VTLPAGEFCVGPRGLAHRTLAAAEAEVLVFERIDRDAKLGQRGGRNIHYAQ
jgi:hypothetical protein